jgi:hypothetical protein
VSFDQCVFVAHLEQYLLVLCLSETLTAVSRFIHIVNGQLMAVMVDDDPESSNNQAGIFGIEVEAVTKVFVRNIWLKKLN